MSDIFSPEIVLALLPLAYLVLQIGAILAMRGWLRTGAWICAGIMGAILAFVILATVVGGSNIAPVLVFLALPFLVPALLVLWVLHIIVRRRPDTRYL